MKSCLPKSKIFELGYDLEILVIDGGSTDLTRDIAYKWVQSLSWKNKRDMGEHIR